MITLIGFMKHPKNDYIPENLRNLKFPMEVEEIDRECYAGSEYEFKYFNLKYLSIWHPTWFETNDADLNTKIKQFLDEEQNKKNKE
jgi:hypothetical protein